jgi:hypothetical protein
VSTFERFLFLAGPEGLGKKTSKFGLEEPNVRRNNVINNCIGVSASIIDYY